MLPYDIWTLSNADCFSNQQNAWIIPNLQNSDWKSWKYRRKNEAKLICSSLVLSTFLVGHLQMASEFSSKNSSRILVGTAAGFATLKAKSEIQFYIFFLNACAWFIIFCMKCILYNGKKLFWSCKLANTNTNS